MCTCMIEHPNENIIHCIYSCEMQIVCLRTTDSNFSQLLSNPCSVELFDNKAHQICIVYQESYMRGKTKTVPN